MSRTVWPSSTKEDSLCAARAGRQTRHCKLKDQKCENYRKVCQSFHKTGQNLWMQRARQRGIPLWFPARTPNLVPVIIFFWLNRFQSCNSLKGDKNLQGQIGLAKKKKKKWQKATKKDSESANNTVTALNVCTVIAALGWLTRRGEE